MDISKDITARSADSVASVRSWQRISSISAVIREMGLRWVLYRIMHAAERKSGLLRLRNHPRTWEEERRRVMEQGTDLKLDNDRCRFLFCGLSRQMRVTTADRTAILEEADAVLAGQWRYFGTTRINIGFPPDWNRNPLSGESAPSDCHWSLIGDTQYGDIKFIWEASRLTPVFALSRAYAAGADERYAEGFWTLVESWAKSNSPNLGPNWKCGQEAAFRIMALYFGLYAFANSRQTTPERVQLALLVIAVLAERIERNIGYALSQNNNHGVSEAAALWTVGLLNPEWQHSKRRKERGRKLLERLAREQFYTDGSYIQHSANYHRLVLHDYIWAMRLGELNDQRFSDGLYDIIGRAVAFLSSLVDPATGQVPNYGHNDGARILPLNVCDYTDFRPVVQAGHYLATRQHRYEPGPWDEDLFWLFGSEALSNDAATLRRALPQQPTPVAKPGGCYVLKGGRTQAMIRCTKYSHRPAHADQLHMDLWWRGLNVACDPGTYLYNGVPPWRNALASTCVHNTVMIDCRDQMIRSGTFLWQHWAEGKTNELRFDADGYTYWEGEHNGYSDLNVVHRRSVFRCQNESWIVVDDVLGTGRHRARLQWLLPDFPYELLDRGLMLNTPVGLCAAQFWCSNAATTSVVRGGRYIFGSACDEAYRAQDEVRGWIAPSYGDKRPALSIALDVSGELPLRFCTVFRDAAVRLSMRPDCIAIEDESGNQTVPLSPIGVSPLVPKVAKSMILSVADCSETRK